MAPHELIASEAYFIGIRAEQYGLEADPDHGSRVPKHYPQQKNKHPTKDNSRKRCILEVVYRKDSPDVPLALSPYQLPNEIPCKADPKRASANIAFSRPIEAHDFKRNASPRGCNSHSPELTVWSELSHAPSAPQTVLVWGNTFF